MGCFLLVINHPGSSQPLIQTAIKLPSMHLQPRASVFYKCCLQTPLRELPVEKHYMLIRQMLQYQILHISEVRLNFCRPGEPLQ